MIYYHFTVFCETEQAWREVINTTGVPPESCPVDSAHTIRANSVSISKLTDTAVQDVEVKKTPDPAPFAAPSFRTKRAATASLITIQPNSSENIDYTLLEERYVHGGQMILVGAQIGDYVEAMIVDTLGIIPEAYRAAVCENYPIVATYIIKEWVLAEVHTIDTYPLNAKISAGLTLRVKYHAAASGTDRQVGVTYYLTKKV